MLEPVNNIRNGASSSEDGDEKGSGAQAAEHRPSPLAPSDLGLCHVHRHRKMDCERPEGDGSEESDNCVEERERHGRRRREHDKGRAEDQLAEGEAESSSLAEWERENVLLVEEGGLWPLLREVVFVFCVDRLPIHLRK